jgi:CHAD domain-containing protein
MDFQISKKEKPGAGLRRILLNEMKAARCELQGRGEGCTEKEAIHLFRKRCKRIRSLLHLARPALGRKFEKWEAQVAQMARDLSATRDRAVMGESLRWLGLATCGEAEDLRTGVSRMPEMLAMAKRFKKLRGEVKKLKFAEIDGDKLWSAFSETRQRLRLEWKRVSRQPSDDRLHRLRRWANYYRHQLNALSECAPEKNQKVERQLAKLIEAIGKAHDLQVLRDHLHPSSKFRALRRCIDDAELRRVETAFIKGAKLFERRYGSLAKGVRGLICAWG